MDGIGYRLLSGLSQHAIGRKCEAVFRKAGGDGLMRRGVRLLNHIERLGSLTMSVCPHGDQQYLIPNAVLIIVAEIALTFYIAQNLVA